MTWPVQGPELGSMHQVAPAKLDFHCDFSTMLTAVDSGVAAFPYGELKEVGWGFRKDDKELQAAFEQFWQEAQQSDQDSVLNKVWKDTFGLSYAKYVRRVTKIK